MLGHVGSMLSPCGPTFMFGRVGPMLGPCWGYVGPCLFNLFNYTNVDPKQKNSTCRTVARHGAVGGKNTSITKYPKNNAGRESGKEVREMGDK